MLLPSAKPKSGPGKLMSASTIKSARLLLQWQNTIDIGLCSSHSGSQLHSYNK
jgi:hypothetical protein